MSTVKFANGTTIEATVYGASAQYQGMQRKTLEIVVQDSDVTFDEAKALWLNAEATKEIVISEQVEATSSETGETTSRTETSVHLNYTLPVELKCTQYGNVCALRIKLAQMSEMEVGLAKQAQDIEDANAALCELAEIIAGGDE